MLFAANVPGTELLVAATDGNELVHGEGSRTSIEGLPRGLAVARYASVSPDSLPEKRAFAMVLVDGVGLHLFTIPDLSRVDGEIADQLLEMSKGAHTFSVDSLGSDLVGESFRVALAAGETVSLLDINPTRGKVTTLGEHSLSERVASVAFSEMTIVASTSTLHNMLRISRGGGLAVAATVNRTDVVRRTSASTAVGEGSAAVRSFFGGLFGVRELASNEPSVAFALPDNRWLLVVDQELIVYSSFGAKQEEIENVFRSKSGMNLLKTANAGAGANIDKTTEASKHPKTPSGSSFASVTTGISHKTFLDESLARRSEKPPVDTVFTSPFVLSVTGKSELVAYASNGSVPGILEELALCSEDEKHEDGVKIVSSRFDRVLATAYWPSGRVVVVELVKDLEMLIEEKETSNELRLALALVPVDQVDRMIALRRLLAADARVQAWHDAAIHHLECVVNLSVKREGIDSLDLVSEAIELRGSDDSEWRADMVTATMWADFLFRLRRRVMRPSVADVHVLETLCFADESASRVKSLLSVKHDIPLSTGEALITASECSLREEERVEALVALYTSLAEHGKALLLLENSDSTDSFDGVVGYLFSSMRASDDPEAYFSHLKWLAHNAAEQSQGREKLERVVFNVVRDTAESEPLLGRVFEVLVEEADDLVEKVVEKTFMASEGSGADERAKVHANDAAEGANSVAISADVLASALLTGMAKADMLDKKEVFRNLRSLFGAKVLHHPNASYHSYTLLQALQTPEKKALGLHEELAFLLGRQGRHEAAADELAAEHSLAPEEALSRLIRMLPASDRASAADSLVAAYLRVSAQGRAMRIQDAADVLKCACGTLEIEKVLLDGRCSDDSLSLTEMLPFLRAALISGSERLRMAEMLRAMRKSEVRRLREEVLSSRRRFVLIGHDRACTLCTRRIGDSVFAAYPDGSVAHLACHMSKDIH